MKQLIIFFVVAAVACAELNGTSSNQCPGSKQQCRPGQTCCRLSDTSFGCCNIENAVCCKDGCCKPGQMCLNYFKSCM